MLKISNQIFIYYLKIFSYIYIKKTMTLKVEDIDYNKEYKEHKRCPNCNRKTAGEEQYKNIRSNKLTKTCDKCRSAVYKSYRKKPRVKPKRLKMKDKIDILKSLLGDTDNDKINELIEQHPDKEEYLKTFISDDDE
jgi:hypothetical protein